MEHKIKERLDLVKQGVLEIVEQPQLDLTLDEMRAAIEKGEFSVDAEAIADKLLSNAQEILSRSRG